MIQTSVGHIRSVKNAQQRLSLFNIESKFSDPQRSLSLRTLFKYHIFTKLDVCKIIPNTKVYNILYNIFIPASNS